MSLRPGASAAPAGPGIAPADLALGGCAFFAVTGAALAGGTPDAPVLATLGGGLAALAWFRGVRGLPWRALGFRLPPLGEALFAPALAAGLVGLAVAGALVAGARAVPPPEGWAALAIRVAALSAEVFLANLVAEEFLFRGCLLGGLRRFGDGRALVVSSALFGLWHAPVGLYRHGLPAAGCLAYALSMGLFGAACGRIYLRSGGSVVPAALFHGAWNGLAYTLFPYPGTAGILSGAGAAAAHPEFSALGIVLPVVALSLIGCPFAGNREACECQEGDAG